MSETETIEQKTYRLMMHVYGESLLSEERAVKSKNFRYFCQLVELAIAEERQRFERICRDHHAKWHDGVVPEPHGPLDCIADIYKQDEVPK